MTSMALIAIIGVVSVLMAVLFKGNKSEYGTYIVLAACIIIFFYSAARLSDVLEVVNLVGGYASINNTYLSLLLKILGIAYIAEFASDICRDSGYSSIANQIQIFGKLTVLSLSLPIVTALFETINTYM